MAQRHKPITEYSEYSHIVNEWHPTKNGNLQPEDVTLGSNKKVWFLCKECGNEWKTRVTDRVTKNVGCIVCGRSKRGDNIRKTKTTITLWSKREEFPRLIKEYSPDNIIPVEEVAWKSHKHCLWKCSTCKHTWSTAPLARILGNQGCPSCARQNRGESIRKAKIKITLWDKRQDFPWLVNEYSLENPILVNNISYRSAKLCIWICSKCHHKWATSPDRRIGRNYGCPKCKRSSLEKILRHILEKNNIEFEEQYPFHPLTRKRSLFFDFKISYNNIIIFIECQGKQHYSYEEFFGASNPEKAFKLVKERDQIKKDYTKTMNIPLIEIPYWIKNIEEYLFENLNEISYIYRAY